MNICEREEMHNGLQAIGARKNFVALFLRNLGEKQLRRVESRSTWMSNESTVLTARDLPAFYVRALSS
uniref:3'-5' exonuclease domain-containing protein n=1 Tax=Ascaris lumbricoides TaxID=6252 RepID=A0A0M3I9E5_ASCLU